jgi:hypothetical protein
MRTLIEKNEIAKLEQKMPRVVDIYIYRSGGFEEDEQPIAGGKFSPLLEDGDIEAIFRHHAQAKGVCAPRVIEVVRAVPEYYEE